MTSQFPSLDVAVQRWITNTNGFVLPVPRSEEITREAEALRATLARGEAAMHVGAVADDHTLALLSLLSRELKSAVAPSEETLRAAENAYDWLQSLEAPAGEFGEVSEILCSLAFVAWRHSRALAQLRRSQSWLERLELVLAQDSVSLACLECFRAVPHNERSDELNSAFLSDAETLLLICSRLRERRNSEPGDAGIEARALFQW